MAKTAERPVFYSFRRCPYAIRARLAVASSGVETELREILLRDKAPEFLEASPKGTVPVMVLPDGTVLEESLDVMQWALGLNDPENLLAADSGQRADMRVLVERCESEFKPHLDRFKYHVRYENVDPEAEREIASRYLWELQGRLKGQDYLFGDRISFADIGIAPFVRQFANSSRDWFEGQDWPDLLAWLRAFETSERFQSIMTKYPKWQNGDPLTIFGADQIADTTAQTVQTQEQ